MKTFYEVRELCEDCSNLYDHTIEEAEYKGRKVKLNDPSRSNDGKKKFTFVGGTLRIKEAKTRS